MIRGAALFAIGATFGYPWPTAVDLALYASGWIAGWFLLWRLRPLPAATRGTTRRPIAIVVPARDEAAALAHLLPPPSASSRPATS